MVMICQCLKLIFQCFHFGIPQATEGKNKYVGEKNLKMWTLIDVLAEGTTIVVPLLTGKEADLMTTLADHAGGGIMIFKGDTLGDSSFLTKCKAMRETRGGDWVTLYTVAVECYNVPNARDIV